MESSYLCNAINNCDFLLLNFSDELQPQTRFNEHNLYIIGTAHHSAVSNHRCIGAVAGLSENMDGACAFFMPILIVPPRNLGENY